MEIKRQPFPTMSVLLYIRELYLHFKLVFGMSILYLEIAIIIVSMWRIKSIKTYLMTEDKVPMYLWLAFTLLDMQNKMWFQDAILMTNSFVHWQSLVWKYSNRAGQLKASKTKKKKKVTANKDLSVLLLQGMSTFRFYFLLICWISVGTKVQLSATLVLSKAQLFLCLIISHFMNRMCVCPLLQLNHNLWNKIKLIPITT